MILVMRNAFCTLVILPIFISPPAFADSLQSLSRKFKSRLNADKPLTVAVLDFTYTRGRVSSGSRIVPERLTTYLVQAGARVVERRLIQQLLTEKKFLQTGMVDLTRVREEKEIIGVDALVTGTLSDSPDGTTEVVARVIKVDTAEILAAGVVVVPREWSDSPRLPPGADTRTPIPFVNAEMGFAKQEHNRRHTLADTDPSKKKPRYYPAPVPLFMPPAASNFQKGGLK